VLSVKILSTNRGKGVTVDRLVVSTSEVWDKVPEGSTLIFGDTQISLKHAVGRVKRSLHAKNQLDSSNHFDTIPACDGRT